MMQLTKSGTIVAETAEDLDRLRVQFDEQHCIRFRGLLEPQLLCALQQQIERAEFYERVHEIVGPSPPIDMCMKDNSVSEALHFVVNDREFVRVVEKVTGCGTIGSFFGSVYRLAPTLGHYDSWHSDVIENRMLALSMNLSTAVYRGGVLQIRNEESGQIVHEVANTSPGDAIVFRIAPYLKHRVSPIEGTTPRTAFAGWFYPQPEYHAWLKQRLAATECEHNGATGSV